MIFKADKLEKAIVERPRGGTGQIRSSIAFPMGKAPAGSAFQTVACQELLPGSSVGFHVHADNEELFVIISGQGSFTDFDGSRHPVGPGDILLTLRGQGHALANTGSEPLAFLAAIAGN